MNGKSKAPEVVLKLEHDLSEAERQYQDSASSEAFLSACERLRQVSARAKHAPVEAVKEQEALTAAGRLVKLPGTGGDQSVVLPSNDWLEPARRAAQGIPSLRDLRLAIFPGQKKSDSSTGQSRSESVLLRAASEHAQGEARRAQGELLIAFDAFSEQLENVKRAAEGYVLARLALEAAQLGSPRADSDGESIDELVLSEIAQLPVLNGVEEFYVPR